MITQLIYVFIFIILYHYVIYPFLIMILNFLILKKERNNEYSPSVSVIIVTRNNPGIKQRIDNIRSQNYDQDKIDIVVMVDNDEETYSIIRERNDIQHYNSPERSGKSVLINKAVELAEYDILIFTDDNTKFDGDNIMNLVKPFFYTNTAGVCGKLILKGSWLESFYWRIESFYKEVQGKLNVVIGANGANYAIRKQYFEKLPEDKMLMDDFIICLNAMKKGDFTYKKNAIAYENYDKTVMNDLLRKKRIGMANYNSFLAISSLFKKRKNILIFFFMLSQKYLRWFMAPILFILFALMTLSPIEDTFFKILFMLLFVNYTVSVIVYLKKSKFASFFLGNIFLFWGFISSKQEKSRPFWDI